MDGGRYELKQFKLNQYPADNWLDRRARARDGSQGCATSPPGN
jgi:hypothetical protein